MGLFRASLLASLGFGALLSSGMVGACAGTPPCQKNSDCNHGHHCVEEECVQDCDPDLDPEIDCPIGYGCNQNGECVYGTAGAGGDGGEGGGGAGDGPGGSGQGAGPAGPGGSGPGPTTGGGGTGTGTPIGKALLERCQVGECDGALTCRALVKNGPMRCTKACATNAECPSGLRCIGNQCLGDDIGRTCTDPTPCNEFCLQGPTPSYCTAACNSGLDCPNGYGCMAIGMTSACVKDEAMCSMADATACAGGCDVSPSLILGSCTNPCTSALDCPQRGLPLPPWTCEGGFCTRPPDVYGPLPQAWTPTEWHCDQNSQPVVLCNDAHHIDFINFTIPPAPNVNCGSMFTTPGVAGDSCVNSCRYDGGCVFNHACVALGQVNGQRMGLCLPVGNKEPGDTCTQNTECAFAYCANNVCSRDCTKDGECPGPLSCVAAGGPAVEGLPFRRCQ